ncbi:MAG TPA: hypothetical protein VM820_22140 [Vicinamibacterales bacterium]|nr:hypothetical protein [Vicinamibacterales bacterium]
MLLVTAAACADDSDHITRRDCERLRDHVVGLRLERVTVDREQHKAALVASLGDGFIDACLTSITPTGLRCRLDARATDALAACRDQ